MVRLHEAKWLAMRIGDRSAHASSLAELGILHHEQGDLSAAAAHCEEALRVAEAIPDLLVVAQTCTALAEIEARLDTEAAFGFVRRAIGLCQHTGNVALEAHAHDVHGSLLTAVGDNAGARTAWLRAVELYERLGSPAGIAAVRAKLAAG